LDPSWGLHILRFFIFIFLSLEDNIIKTAKTLYPFCCIIHNDPVVFVFNILFSQWCFTVTKEVTAVLCALSCCVSLCYY
jgi:hypothetical protein